MYRGVDAVAYNDICVNDDRLVRYRQVRAISSDHRVIWSGTNDMLDIVQKSWMLIGPGEARVQQIVGVYMLNNCFISPSVATLKGVPFIVEQCLFHHMLSHAGKTVIWKYNRNASIHIAQTRCVTTIRCLGVIPSLFSL